MKGDFTRFTFDRSKHFIRVLEQQGQVQVDANQNELAAILLYYLQALAADLVGPHGGPTGNFGFKIVVDEEDLSEKEKQQLEQSNLQLEPPDFFITTGHYYVDGILCESDTVSTYNHQPDYLRPDSEKLQGDKTHLVYLDVWERHITHIEDDSIREVALGESDTATRAKVVWQVKTLELTPERLSEGKLDGINITADCTSLNENWQALVRQWWQPENRGLLKAKAKEPEGADLTDPCITPPEARYRGAENQLYRVEIHTGSKDENGNPATPTFKWSRDNGSVVFPVRKLTVTTEGETTTATVIVDHLGRDSRFGLQEGDWVEIVDDDYVLQRRAKPLLKVVSVDRVNMQVTLEGTLVSQVGQDPSKHPLLRRWDHKAGDPEQRGLQLHEGAALILEGEGDKNWLILEDGVQIQFKEPDGGQSENRYRTGDYWLIPARTVTGDVEWPGPVGAPEAVPPHGVEHHYAPLAIISVSGESVEVTGDCRYQFELTRNPVS